MDQAIVNTANRMFAYLTGDEGATICLEEGFFEHIGFDPMSKIGPLLEEGADATFNARVMLRVADLFLGQEGG